MFGLEKISWTQFLLLLLYSSGIWYAGMFVLARIRGQTRDAKILYEDDDEGETTTEDFIPLAVLAADFPKEMISQAAREDEDLIMNLYEENNIDDGYPLEQFSERNLTESPQILENFQIQK